MITSRLVVASWTASAIALVFVMASAVVSSASRSDAALADRPSATTAPDVSTETPENPPGAAPKSKVEAPHVSTIGMRCSGCHADLVRTYRETGMARALGPISAGELADLAEVKDGSTGFAYQYEESAGRARIVETWRDPAGGATPRTVRDSAEIVAAVGAGLVDRAYVAQRGELVWFAPLEILRSKTDGKRSATLSPGHSIQPGSRFTIPITEECLRCHTSALPPRDYPLNLVPPKDWHPTGIDCVGCHEAGFEHATWRERELAGEVREGVDPLHRTRSRTTIESVSLCARCHLQGDANLAIAAPLRGIAPAEGDLLSKRAIFVAKTPTTDIGFVSQVERMVLSRCFTESLDAAAPMTCATCHDPHRSIAGDASRDRVRAGCLACHPDGEDRHTEVANACSLKRGERGSSDCASCHMRRTGVFDVGTVEIHDHWIRRAPAQASPRAPLRAKESKDGELTLFEWPKHAAREHALDPGLWMMAKVSVGAFDAAFVDARREPGSLSKSLPMYHHIRATLFERADQVPLAIASYQAALAIDPHQAESSVNLAPLLGRVARDREGLALLDAVIRDHPRAEGALRNRALLRLKGGDADGFALDLQAAQTVLPRAANAAALAQYWGKRGRVDLGRDWREEAGRLDPK